MVSNHTETPTFSAAEKVTWVRATRTEVAINMDRDRQWMLHPGVQDSRCSVICRALGFFIFFSSWTLVCLVHHNNHITLDAPKISCWICVNLWALVMYDPPSTSRVEWDKGKKGVHNFQHKGERWIIFELFPLCYLCCTCLCLWLRKWSKGPLTTIHPPSFSSSTEAQFQKVVYLAKSSEKQ